MYKPGQIVPMKEYRAALDPSRSKSKYGNKKVTIAGIKFDSKLEAKRYTQLKMLERGGAIQNLTLQPKFILQEAFVLDGTKYQSIAYVSDFKYIDDQGNVIIEDIKGKITKEYAIKKKMFLLRYGKEVTFKELYAGDF